jgi:hypothetical protein
MSMPMLAGVGLLVICCSSSSAMMMMGGEETPTPTPTPTPAAVAKTPKQEQADEAKAALAALKADPDATPDEITAAQTAADNAQTAADAETENEPDNDQAAAAAAAGPTFDPPVVPTDEASEGKCYLSRYTDIRLAYKNDGAKALTNKSGRNISCVMSDEEAQCYLNRYSDAQAYAGTDLNGARKHYYEVGKALNYDFVCPPGKKEIACYMVNNPDMAAGLSTGGWGRDYNALQHWNNTGRAAGLSYTCT